MKILKVVNFFEKMCMEFFDAENTEVPSVLCVDQNVF